MTTKPECSHLEVALDTKKNAIAPVGTVTLVDHNELVLIPTPSPDPRDPLNLSQWRKWLILITLGLFSITSVLLTSGMGPIFAEVKASYNNDPKSSDLMTYPTLFMGIGNLISMPLAMAVGRRPIFTCSAVILVIGSIWCASSSSLGSHIAGRDILSLAAGQSEALCPLIIQEVHFLHERSRKLAYFSATQSIGTAALYGVFGIVNFFILILALLFVPESRYNRPTDAFEGEVHISRNAQHSEGVLRVTTHHGVELDLIRYQPRSIKYDLKIYHGPANWNAATECLKHMSQCILFPNILWVILMNSCVLGIYVVMVTEFSTILSSPPYNVPFTSLGFVQGGQIVVSMIMVPVLGYGSDFLTQFLARRNGGVSEPEYRIILMILPAVVVVISCVFFGLAGEHPTQWSSWAVIISYNAEYFGFIGIVLIGFIYTLDSYPERAGPALVLICAVRGLVSFGIGFGVTNFIEGQGYERAISVICATVMGALSLLILPVCWWRKKIRRATAKYAMDHIVAE